MKLNVLFEQIKAIDDLFHNIEISGISTKSGNVHPNELFVAIPGFRTDGHDYIEDAIQHGATVVVGEKDIKDLSIPQLLDEKDSKEMGRKLDEFVLYIQVENSRSTLAKLACQFYQHPAKNKKVIGITGTNGKTTITFMIKHILETNGHSCALFSTIYNVINGKVLPSTNTTPDALELQKQLSLSADEFIVMEVSSHGLSQYRVEGIEFDYCLFTNLDHDHLDYHRDMETYFLTKASLFEQLKPQGKAIINAYDEWGRRLAQRLISKGSDILLIGEDLQLKKNHTGTPIIITEGNREVNMQLQMLGQHNFLNACMAFLTAKMIGIPEQNILQSLESFNGVPGRFEMLEHPNGATIVIDYAHTADAFYQCLNTIREQGAKRIYHIFGFRGNRDTKKRERMMEVSKELCDFTLLTLDDLNDVPIDEMKETLVILHEEIELDRTLAIKKVLEQMTEGDWACITGKGPEPYKETFQIPTSSDKETVEYLLKKLNTHPNTT